MRPWPTHAGRYTGRPLPLPPTPHPHFTSHTPLVKALAFSPPELTTHKPHAFLSPPPLPFSLLPSQQRCQRTVGACRGSRSVNTSQNGLGRRRHRAPGRVRDPSSVFAYNISVLAPLFLHATAMRWRLTTQMTPRPRRHLAVRPFRYLYKVGNGHKTWKRRWFVLTGTYGFFSLSGVPSKRPLAL